MPAGVFRPYSLTDVLGAIASQNGQGTQDTSVNGVGDFGEVDETLTASITRGPASNLLESHADGGAVAWPINPLPGSKVLVAVWTSSNESITSVVDNGTTPTTFSLDVSTTDSANQLLCIYRADNITSPAAGSSYTVTVTGSGGHTVVAGGVAYTGVPTGPPTSVSTNGGATGTAISTGSVTPATPAALLFAAFTNNSFVTETISAAGGGFTNQFTETNGSTYAPGAAADLIASGSPAATACTWTVSQSVSWAAVVVTYQGASDSATATTQLPTGWDGGDWCQFSWGDELQLLAATPLAGFPLQNGTPTILSWTAPNDGQMHRVLIAMIGKVTTTEVGGIINATGQDPGGNGFTSQLDGGAHGGGATIVGSVRFFPVAPGTTFSIVQGSALTAGAATLWAELWGQ